jgi:hypothetical protein
VIFGGIFAKVFGLVAAVIALFFVAWYFYIHDHAARTTGGIEVSLGRAASGHHDAHCRDRGRNWRCTVGGRTYLVEPTRKNCWRVREPKLDGCVKVLDYVGGLF